MLLLLSEKQFLGYDRFSLKFIDLRYRPIDSICNRVMAPCIYGLLFEGGVGDLIILQSAVSQ